MAKLSYLIGSDSEYRFYLKTYGFSRVSIKKYFLDPYDLIFKDSTPDVLLSESHQAKFSNHFGYVNLFPLFFGYVEPHSKELRRVMSLLSKKNDMISKDGLRSLSFSDNFFGTKGNYWRGKIWIPHNYLLLRGIINHYINSTSWNSLFNNLRKKIVHTVCNNFEISQTFFENYNGISGDGSDSEYFNGWTSLITLIISGNF